MLFYNLSKTIVWTARHTSSMPPFLRQNAFSLILLHLAGLQSSLFLPLGILPPQSLLDLIWSHNLPHFMLLLPCVL